MLLENVGCDVGTSVDRGTFTIGEDLIDVDRSGDGDGESEGEDNDSDDNGDSVGNADWNGGCESDGADVSNGDFDGANVGKPVVIVGDFCPISIPFLEPQQWTSYVRLPLT